MLPDTYSYSEDLSDIVHQCNEMIIGCETIRPHQYIDQKARAHLYNDSATEETINTFRQKINETYQTITQAEMRWGTVFTTKQRLATALNNSIFLQGHVNCPEEETMINYTLKGINKVKNEAQAKLTAENASAVNPFSNLMSLVTRLA